MFLTQACNLAKQRATPQAPCSTPYSAASWCLWAHSSHLSPHLCVRAPSRVYSASPPALLSWCPSKGGSGDSTLVPIAFPCTKRSFILQSLGSTNKPIQRPKLGKVMCKTGLETVAPENIDDCLHPLVSLLPIETGGPTFAGRRARALTGPHGALWWPSLEWLCRKRAEPRALRPGHPVLSPDGLLSGHHFHPG